MRRGRRGRDRLACRMDNGESSVRTFEDAHVDKRDVAPTQELLRPDNE